MHSVFGIGRKRIETCLYLQKRPFYISIVLFHFQAGLYIPRIFFQQLYSILPTLILFKGKTRTTHIQGEHSAKLSTFIKLPFVIKIFILSILSDRFAQMSINAQIYCINANTISKVFFSVLPSELDSILYCFW